MTSRLAAFLNPGSIALVGCPRDLDRPGARPLVYLTQHGYPGRLYPVNPRHAEIAGRRVYPSLGELPERPDMAWIGVPNADVEGVLEEVARLKIPHAVILTAGFGETDGTGRRRQAALGEIATAGGVTVLGPNVLGFINCWDRVPLTFSSTGGIDRLRPGSLGIASQSGALGGVAANRAFDRGIGVSAMISTGNELDVTVSECLEYFAEDSRTQAVALVAEGIRDGERFKAAAARLLEAGKPLVALKLGRSTAGRRNALTHTGALTGAPEAWSAVARQLGIVEAETFEELIEVAGFLSRERRSPRRGVAVLTTSGGASIMTADQLEARGFSFPRLALSTVGTLGRLLPEYAVTRDNPVDVTAGLSETLYADVLAALARDPNVDAVVATVTAARGVERARNIARVAREAPKPVVACWLGGSLTEEGITELEGAGVPCFRSPRTVAQALAAARDVAVRRAAWPGGRRRPGRGGVALARAAARLGASPSYAELSALARRAGIPLAPEALVRTPAEAARAARRLGFPVALKAVAPDLPHKTGAGAVALDLADGAEVAAAARRLLARTRRYRREGLLVQRMVRGVEVLVGVTRDPTFGPLLVL
ncbi:MAG: acetate--CoA ligase family protein, partial [Candidatus Rokubacteria bacterium]|nr:acetate--CoA ligase family protein [Candidatus Rokubacteria bacterium]